MKIIHTVSIVCVMAACAAPAAAQAPGEVRLPAFPRLLDLPLFELQRPPQPPQPPRGPRGPRGNQPRGPETNENFSRSVRLGGNGTLDLQNLSGSVVISGGGGNEAVIQAVKRAFGGASDDERRARLQDVQIEVLEQSNRVEVRSRYQDNNRRGPGSAVSIDYTITVPQNASLYVRNTTGDVRVTNVRGDLRVETLSGDISASGARRIGLLKTVSGSVAVTDAQVEDDVTLQTLSGDLTLTNVRARAVDVSAVSGDLQLNDVQSDRVIARSSNGDITFSGTLQRTGRYEFTTQSGDIRLALGGNGGFDVDASTFNGELQSAFPLTLGGADVNTASNGRRPRGIGQAVRGRFGDGGAAVSLRSFNGDLTITRR